MTHQTVPPLLTNAPIHIGFMPGAAEINRQIMDAYQQLRTEDLKRRSHFFGGRYENLYLERESIAGIGQILAHAEHYAKTLLQQPEHALRSGFWINDMGHGEVTSEHDHDEYDELLSGVYYLQIPPESGELVIVDKYSRTLLTPQAGMFVFFAPDVRHSVSVNRSGERRVSIGMNFGPVHKQ